MKHLWVVESSSGKKWRPVGGAMAHSYFNKNAAKGAMKFNAECSPGLKWRVAKYVREVGK